MCIKDVQCCHGNEPMYMYVYMYDLAPNIHVHVHVGNRWFFPEGGTRADGGTCWTQWKWKINHTPAITEIL